MSYQKDRDEFIVICAREGLSLSTSRALLGLARTLHRLAEAQCTYQNRRLPDNRHKFADLISADVLQEEVAVPERYAAIGGSC